MTERRPVQGAGGQSSRRQVPQRPERSGRNARGDVEEDDKGTLKLVLLFGSGALALLVIVLFVMKAPVIFGPKPVPPKKVVIDHNKALTEVDALAKKAATQFADAKRVKDTAERNKAIRGALETLAAAQEKLQELSERREYQGEEYDQVFEEKQHRLSQEMKLYRDALTVGGR